MDRLPEFLSFEYSDKTDGGPHCNNGLSGWYYFLPAWISTTTAENERYYYITQENVYTTFTMPNRENRQLHPLEPNSYCPPTFPFVRTYGWLCTDLETVSSRELKTLTSTLLYYASYTKTVNLTARIKTYHSSYSSTASQTNYGEEHNASLT